MEDQNKTNDRKNRFDKNEIEAFKPSNGITAMQMIEQFKNQMGIKPNYELPPNIKNAKGKVKNWLPKNLLRRSPSRFSRDTENGFSPKHKNFDLSPNNRYPLGSKDFKSPDLKLKTFKTTIIGRGNNIPEETNESASPFQIKSKNLDLNKLDIVLHEQDLILANEESVSQASDLDNSVI